MEPATSERVRRVAAILAAVVAFTLVATACVVPPLVGRGGGGTSADLTPYQGLGTWADVLDYVPAYQAPAGRVPDVRPDNLAAMAAVGVKTLYLQAAREDTISTGSLVDTALLGAMLQAAHAAGMKVVAWYLPTLENVERDMVHLRAMVEFKSPGGEQFDGIGVDIESRKVLDPADRSRRLVDLSQQIRRYVGKGTLGAIIIPPVVPDIINTNFWPGFPWEGIGPLYDVWLPMSYWTGRTPQSGYHDGFRYTLDNIDLLRQHIHQPAAPVHPIGGIADASTLDDLAGLVRAATARGALGWSMYDWRTTRPEEWAVLNSHP